MQDMSYCRANPQKPRIYNHPNLEHLSLKLKSVFTEKLEMEDIQVNACIFRNYIYIHNTD